MVTHVHGIEAALDRLTRRAGTTTSTMPPAVAAKTQEVFGTPLSAVEVVERILTDVRTEGDAAVARYTMAFDGALPVAVDVPKQDWEQAWNATQPELKQALTVAAERIRAFHSHQPRQSWIEPTADGTFGQLVRPLERIGIYTPGGSAALPSSLLMVALPARVAGVNEVIIAAPPRNGGEIAPIILAAAWLANVDRVLAIGGAQAIGALAFGTETVPQVDKILGPGNMFVTLAKQQVFGTVAIDQLAGPTETLLVADDTADLVLIAADMLAQSEHGVDSSAILVTTSQRIADGIETELERQSELLPRASIAMASLESNGVVAVVDSISQAIDVANHYAPEHLCLLVDDPWSFMPQVRNAGGIFLGESSPEALGDYTMGPSHVMPTGGTARFSSPVNVNDFLKVISIFGGTKHSVAALGPATITLADAEGLRGHAAAIERRMAPRSGT
jgi:histidinol dehydrogenase